MVRTIQTEHVRQHELSDRAVPCPNALDHDRQSRYGVKAKTGMWITYCERHAGGDFQYRSGRMLGRVTAGAVDGKYPSEAIDGWLSVLALADDMHFAYIRWVKPEDVAVVMQNPPAKLLAWITGPIPDATIVHKLSAYGTLTERYVENVPHHVDAFKLGISPSAYDRGIRGTCAQCGAGVFADRSCEMCDHSRTYEVIVGNIGTVYTGNKYAEALAEFAEYQRQSIGGEGRAGGEDVTIMRDGEPYREHAGKRQAEED